MAEVLVARLRVPATDPEVLVQTGKRRARWRIRAWAVSGGRVTRASLTVRNRCTLRNVLEVALEEVVSLWQEAESTGPVVDGGFELWMA